MYYTYILTNPSKTTLYVGVTNNLAIRLQQHFEHRGNPVTFTGKYHCYNLIYFEEYTDINEAIRREKEIKKWRREKKVALIATQNANWDTIVI